VLATLGVAGVAVVGAAGIGSAVAVLAGLPARRRSADALTPTVASNRATAPAALIAALARETQLIAGATSARGTRPADPILAALLADHQAHAAAIAAAIGAASPRPAPTSSSAPPTPDQLKASEQAAHDAAAAGSATLSGAAAVLLASIAACEAGHVELLAE
jgi:hypothetical protein